MTWILILFLKSGHGGGLTSAEFNNKDACEAAIKQVTERWAPDGWLHNAPFAICVRK